MVKEKEHNYVECQACAWRVIQPDYNPRKHLCHRCNNSRQVIDPREILCNMCGGCMCPLGTHNEQYPHGLHEAMVSGGYNSYHLFDSTDYHFSFCEKCLRKLFIQCKIPPDINYVCEAEQSREELWQEDLRAYEYRIWTDTGGHHQAYLNRKCNAIKDCVNQAVYTRLNLNDDDDFTEDASCEEHKELWKYFNDKLVPFICNKLKPFL